MRESGGPRRLQGEKKLGIIYWQCSCHGQMRTGRLQSKQGRGFHVFSLPGGMSQLVPHPPSIRVRGYGPSCPTSWTALIQQCYFQLMYLQEKHLDSTRRGEEPPSLGPAARLLCSVMRYPKALDFAYPIHTSYRVVTEPPLGSLADELKHTSSANLFP